MSQVNHTMQLSEQFAHVRLVPAVSDTGGVP